MKTSETALKFIKDFSRCYLEKYNLEIDECIGYDHINPRFLYSHHMRGHNNEEEVIPDKITQSQADEYFLKDIEECENLITEIMNADNESDRTQTKFDAMMVLFFLVGTSTADKLYMKYKGSGCRAFFETIPNPNDFKYTRYGDDRDRYTSIYCDFTNWIFRIVDNRAYIRAVKNVKFRGRELEYEWNESANFDLTCIIRYAWFLYNDGVYKKWYEL